MASKYAVTVASGPAAGVVSEASASWDSAGSSVYGVSVYGSSVDGWSVYGSSV
ncbi:hypothetical protein [Streptomyces geysiriensis]|uniref:hypothetical protein n=1 Tax=Streptomyces geysiriensis TaxID=68207 RepID=UPI001C7DBAE3|nr:hypothetical protein [Streptomyces geysiriensis]MBX4174321.1 hypothetical protein [Streptomyces geysiriensis]